MTGPSSPFRAFLPLPTETRTAIMIGLARPLTSAVAFPSPRVPLMQYCARGAVLRTLVSTFR